MILLLVLDFKLFTQFFFFAFFIQSVTSFFVFADFPIFCLIVIPFTEPFQRKRDIFLVVRTYCHKPILFIIGRTIIVNVGVFDEKLATSTEIRIISITYYPVNLTLNRINKRINDLDLIFYRQLFEKFLNCLCGTGKLFSIVFFHSHQS